MGPPPCTWMSPFLPFLPFPLLPFGPLLVFVFPISIFLPVVASIAVRSWHGNIGGARRLAQKIKRLIVFLNSENLNLQATRIAAGLHKFVACKRHSLHRSSLRSGVRRK